jgi:hypothetical protein
VDGFFRVDGFAFLIVVFRVRYPLAAMGAVIAVVSGDIDTVPADMAGSEIIVLFHGDLLFGWIAGRLRCV